jgi:hypothetical protein
MRELTIRASHPWLTAIHCDTLRASNHGTNFVAVHFWTSDFYIQQRGYSDVAWHPSHLWFWCKYFRFRALSLMVTTRARWHRPRLSSIWPSNHTHCDAHQGPQGTSEEESPKGSKSSIIFMISCKTIVHNKKGVSLPYGFHHINAHLCLIHGQHAMLGEG